MLLRYKKCFLDSDVGTLNSIFLAIFLYMLHKNLLQTTDNSLKFDISYVGIQLNLNVRKGNRARGSCATFQYYLNEIGK